MYKLKTFAIAVAALGLSYGSSAAQDDISPSVLTDEEYLALANGEALQMFADEPAPLASGDFEKIYLLDPGQVQSSFFCALEGLVKIAAQIDADQNGLLFVEVADVSPYLNSENCFANPDMVEIVMVDDPES